MEKKDNRRLFSNNFIQTLNGNDLPSSQKEQFRKYHEQRIQTQKRANILEKSVVIPSSNNLSNISASSAGLSGTGKTTTNTDIYANLARFEPGKQGSPFQARQTVKLEKKSIVSIDTRNRDTNKYPNQNDFQVFLGKTFFNIKSIELVSTEFPNTDQVIKELPFELQNNLITWQNEEDYDLNFFTNCPINKVINDYIDITITGHGYTIGNVLTARLYNSIITDVSSTLGIIDAVREITVIDVDTFRFPYAGSISGPGTTSVDLGYPQYSVSIKPGNYTATTLADQISLDMGRVRRRLGKDTDIPQEQFHKFVVSVNLDTDVMTIDSVRVTQLPNNPISTIASSTTITVNQINHGYKTGDRIKMLGIKTLAGIAGSTLNGDFIINVTGLNSFTYEVVTRAGETAEGGGNTVLSGKDAPFRLLFDTENTLIQFNIGFPNEDSSEPVGVTDPLTTKTIEDIVAIDILPSDMLRFTTTNPHGLSAATVITISKITLPVTGDAIFTTSTAHGMTVSTLVTIRGTTTTPVVDGTYLATPTGVSTFIIPDLFIQQPPSTTLPVEIVTPSTSQILYGQDRIQIFNLKSVPNILLRPVYFVEAVTINTFDIKFRATSIDADSIPDTVIGTSQVFVNHPNHGFNQISMITSTNTSFASVKTYLPNDYIGSRVTGLAIDISSTPTNMIDIIYPAHGLQTSDIIDIIESTSSPSVNGTYPIQVVDLNTIRFNFVYDNTFVTGVCTVINGDSVAITGSNSLPRIDGVYTVNNKQRISSIGTPNSTTKRITTASPHNWQINDRVIISGTDVVPSIDGTYTILAVTTNTFDIFFNDVPLKIIGITTGLTPQITTDTSHLLSTGDTIIIANSNCSANIDGSQTVSNVISSTVFEINVVNEVLTLNTRDILSISTGFTPQITTSVNHGLINGDTITITGSDSNPSIDGTHEVIVISAATFQITLSSFAVTVAGSTGLITFSYGEISRTIATSGVAINTVRFEIDLQNRLTVTDISTSTTIENLTNITTSTDHNLIVGSSITISNTNSTPIIDGTYIVTDVLGPRILEISAASPVTVPGDRGNIVNNVSLTSGNTGIIGRNNNVLHYRITGENPGADNLAGMKLTALNGIERPIASLIDANTYMIRVIEEYANKTITGGGSNVHVSSIFHGLRAIQTNTEDGTPTGTLFRAISLEGENYVYLVSEGLDTVINTANISNTFAKILLSESPGNLMFNSFISEPKVFDNPIAKIDTMRFRIVTPEGYPFNFNDINYSFTLRITELVNQLEDAFVSSRTGENEFENLLNRTKLTGTNQGLGDESGKNTSLTNTSGPGFAIRASTGRGSTRIV